MICIKNYTKIKKKHNKPKIYAFESKNLGFSNPFSRPSCYYMVSRWTAAVHATIPHTTQ